MQSVFTVLIGKLLTVFKLSFVLGSHAIMFSASNFFLPLVGLFGRTTGTTIVWTFLLSARLLSGSFSAATLAFYLPGYCAALYLGTSSRLFRCGVPLLAMLFFVTHPIGSQAMLYSCYWLIPFVIGAGFGRSLFTQALGATFMAHAVGSVIWLYTVPMAPAAWLALIPLVAVERLTFAAGMVVMYQVIMQLTYVSSFLAYAFNRSYASLKR